MKTFEVFDRFCSVGMENKGNKIFFLLLKLLLALLFAEVGVDADVMRAFVFTEVEDFEGTEIFTLGFKRPLDLDHALAGCVDGELTEVGADPFTVELFGNRLSIQVLCPSPGT